MLRRDLIHALTAMSLGAWLRPWLPWALGDMADQEPNAAAIYPRAFKWAQGLGLEESRFLRQAATVPLDDRRVDGLIRQAGPVLEAIREAAAVGRCRWQVEAPAYEDLNEGHLSGANTHIVRVACLSARRHARSGRGRQALDDLFAGLTLAHRIGTNGVLIARLFEGMGETAAFETLGRILPELDRETRDDLARRLDTLAPPEPASATVGPESRFVLGTLRAKVLAGGPTIEGEAWAELGFGEDQAETEAIKRLTGGDRARLLAHLDATGPAFDELARRLDLPRPQCRRALDEFVKTQRSAQPVATGLVEAVWGSRIMVERLLTLRVMVRAGLALITSGEPAFRTISDPSRSEPFGLERRGKGYLIRSAKDDYGMPEVTLALGDDE